MPLARRALREAVHEIGAFMMFRTPFIRPRTGFLGMVMALGLVACGMPGVAHATGVPSPDHREATRLMGVPAATVEQPSTISVRARRIQFSRDGSKAFAVGGGRFSVIDVQATAFLAASRSLEREGTW